MQTQQVNTIVIGAGHSGLNVSRALQRLDVEHVVLEKAQIAQTWRDQRWDSFRLNTPDSTNQFVDQKFDDKPSGFPTHRDLIERLETYAAENELPVRTGTEVFEVRSGEETRFEIESADGDVWNTRNVVICTGIQNVPRVPQFADELPSSIHQLHAADYDHPDELPEGAVLIVGGGQTGLQLAEELVGGGRDTYLCTSKVGRAPRRYRGRDVVDWIEESSFGEMTVDDLPDPAMQYARQPHISGTDGGHTLSLQSLARQGVTSLGRLEDVDGARLTIGNDLLENVAFADEVSRQVKAVVDQYIDKAGIDAPEPRPDPAEAPFEGIEAMAAIHGLDLEERGVSTVIWATGFDGDLSYIDFDLQVDEHGFPAHEQGASPVRGLYFVGLPWLRTRQSGILPGAERDARHIAKRIAGRS